MCISTLSPVVVTLYFNINKYLQNAIQYTKSVELYNILFNEWSPTPKWSEKTLQKFRDAIVPLLGVETKLPPYLYTNAIY